MSLTDTILSIGGPPVEAYYCNDVYTNNADSLRQRNLLYTYELVHSCAGTSQQDGIEFIEETMLENARRKYMDDADLCKVPTEFWFAYISRAPADYATGLDCTGFIDADLSEGQCCSVIQGNMTFLELSEADMSQMETWTETKLENGNSPAIFADGTNSYLTRYYGAASGFVPTTTTVTTPSTTVAGPGNSGGDATPSANTNSNADALKGEPYVAPSDSTGWNWMSIVMLCFLVLCVFGFIAFLVHRRQQRRKNADQYGLARHKSLEDDDIEESVGSSNHAWMTPRKVPYPYDMENVEGRRIPSTAQESYEVHVVGDLAQQDSTLEIQAISAQPFCGVDECHIVSPATGAYGYEEEEPPTADAQVLKYSHNGRKGFQNEYDGSEVDSWAQSQGSVGSLGNNGI